VRVKELAGLTGVTVRTVRYYHQIGLLPVPPVRHGGRDYDLAHVARLTRIRWLTRGGVPLSRVAGMLDAVPGTPGTARDAVLVDLDATVLALDDQIADLRSRREQVRRLVTAVTRGEHLSPMPAVAQRFYERLERMAPDERVRRAVRQERDFVELAYYRGEMPDGAELSFQGFDEARTAESLAAFERIARREEDPAPATDEEVAAVVAQVVGRIRRHVGDDLPRMARSMDTAAARRVADLFVRLTERGGRLNRAIADGLLQMLQEERSR
jgi:DNA-binding transcriptional MerR regulator